MKFLKTRYIYSQHISNNMSRRKRTQKNRERGVQLINAQALTKSQKQYNQPQQHKNNKQKNTIQYLTATTKKLTTQQ